MSDEYVRVTAKVRRVTNKAVLLDVGEGVSRGAWIPRSCIYGPDDKVLDAIALDSEITLGVFEWIAEREGLI